MLGKGYQMTGIETAKKVFGVASDRRKRTRRLDGRYWKEEFIKEKVR